MFFVTKLDSEYIKLNILNVIVYEKYVVFKNIIVDNF